MNYQNEQFSELQVRAEHGDAEAQFLLGTEYRTGENAPQSDEAAFFWIEKAAEQGLAKAQFSLGVHYETGCGVAISFEKAFDWYNAAAQQGYAKAQFKLATFYEHGKGVQKSEEKVFFWFQKAAEQNDADAQYLVGLLFHMGKGTPQSYEKAVFWCKKAAEQGIAAAQCFLGNCYINGEGVPQSFDVAFDWLIRAAEQGNDNAKKAFGFSYWIYQNKLYGCSVTGRIKSVKQPLGGYLPPKNFTKETFDDSCILSEEENISAALVGMAVDYLTRFMLGSSVDEAFHISTLGAKAINSEKKSIELKRAVSGLDDTSIIAACKLSGFDVCYRAGKAYYQPIEEINPNQPTINNIRTMVKRSISFFEKYGPVICSEPTFEGGYSNIVSSGDGDFVTKDTLWDFKVSKHRPNCNQTLQLLMYYIMGQHSTHDYFKHIDTIGIFNPRQNTIHICKISSIPQETIREVEEKVLCYNISGNDILKTLFIEEQQRRAAAISRNSKKQSSKKSKYTKQGESVERTTLPNQEIEGYSVADISNLTGRRKSSIYTDIHEKILKADKIKNKYIISFSECSRYIEYLKEQEKQSRRIVFAFIVALLAFLFFLFLYFGFLM